MAEFDTVIRNGTVVEATGYRPTGQTSASRMVRSPR